MAFTPEDGSGLSNSNAYITVQEFRDFHEDRGIDTTAYVDTDVEAGIVKATDYVDKRFGRRYRGAKQTYEQSLEWPRYDAYTDDGYLYRDVPTPLGRGVAEYALLVLQLQRDLAPVPQPDFGIVDPETGTVAPGGGQIVEKSEEVGPIKDSTKWADGNSTGGPMTGTGNMTQQIPAYPQADLWIEEVISPYGNREVFRG